MGARVEKVYKQIVGSVAGTHNQEESGLFPFFPHTKTKGRQIQVIILKDPFDLRQFT